MPENRNVERPKFSMSVEFYDSKERIPLDVQGQLQKFINAYRENPAQLPRGFNYEKLQGIDKSLRSIRLNDNYRIILGVTGKNEIIFLYVDNHEEAYRWATRRRVRGELRNDDLRLVLVPTVEQEIAPGGPEPGLFSKYTDDQLRKLGVPEDNLRCIRNIKNIRQLEQLKVDYTPTVFGALHFLGCGDPYDEVLQAWGPNQERAEGLPNVWSCFMPIYENTNLVQLFEKPLEKWRVFLHPEQHRFATMNANGPVKVTGAAGTGKTVVALHRAKYLAERFYRGQNVQAGHGDKILFTTFNKNLAEDIKDLLASLCDEEMMRHIEVKTIDGWTATFLQKRRLNRNVIDYQEEEVSRLWRNALRLKPVGEEWTDQFFFDEWEQVIQPQNIRSLEQYYGANRRGRGHGLQRGDKVACWPVFERYRTLLGSEHYYTKEDTYRIAREELEKQPKPISDYRAVIVDEGQDFSTAAYAMLRALIPKTDNDMFIVGDSNQRIYSHVPDFGKIGIDIPGARSKKLHVNYRTTRQIYEFATSVLTGENYDDICAGDNRYLACISEVKGDMPVVQRFENQDAEMGHILDSLHNFKNQHMNLSTGCLVCRTEQLLKQYGDFLEQNGIACYVLGKDRRQHDGHGEEKLNLATMHRVKGIEFDFIIVASACENIIPLRTVVGRQENQVDRDNVEKREKSLLYVAMTRARKKLFVTGYGNMSPYLQGHYE